MIIKKIKLGLKAFIEIDNWWTYFADYLGMKNGDIVYEINGNRIMLRGGTIDKSIVTEVALEEKYFPRGLNLGEEPCIIDLGAHIGLFSVLASSKYPNAKIYSIEPAKDNFRLLSKNKKTNNFNMAISNKKGLMKLFSGRHSARPSLLRNEGETSEEVAAVTLREFFETEKIRKCDLLKIDIEGGEYPIFYSTPKEIFDKIDRIFLELHGIEGENQDELLDLLKGMGFKITFKEFNFIYAEKDTQFPD